MIEPPPHGNAELHAAGPLLVSVVVVNYNAWGDVEHLVASLAGTPEVRRGSAEVVVVDNASEGPVPASLREPPRGVRLLARRDNGGFAVGVNAGWRLARGPWILLLNPDVTVPEGWLGRVVERVRSLPSGGGDGAGAPGLIGFMLRNPDGSRQHSVGAFPSLGRAIWEQLIPRSRRKYQAVWRTKSGPVDWVTGACVLINARVLEALGGLDEDFFLYYEEVALCRSARRLGWRVEYDPDPAVAVVHHRPLQNRSLTPRMRVITRHSKLLYFRKHLPRWQFLVLCGVVATEARVRFAWAWLRGDEAARRGWAAVVLVEQSLRSEWPLVGREVLALADAVADDGGLARSLGAPRRASPTVEEPRAGTSRRP